MTDEVIKKTGGDAFRSMIAQGVTLADFYGEWCGPCRMLDPIMEEFAGEMKDKLKFCKLDIDESQDLAGEFQVTSVPTLILFKDGKEINRTIGLKDLAALREFVSESA